MGTKAIELIRSERQRQIEVEGWSALHDDQHDAGELGIAAACYAMPPTIGVRSEHWPWTFEWWKPTPKDRVRELVKAGALIVAEIERLQRLGSKEKFYPTIQFCSEDDDEMIDCYDPSEDCPRCKGSGQVPTESYESYFGDNYKTCPDCGGNG